MCGHAKGDRASGSVFIFTMWILVCLTLMALGLGHRVRLETRATAYTVANTEAFYIAEKALYEKLAELMSTIEQEDGGDGRKDTKARGQRRARAERRRPRRGDDKKKEEEKDVEIRVTAVSEEGKANLNRTPEDLIRRIRPLRGGVAWAIAQKRRGRSVELPGDDYGSEEGQEENEREQRGDVETEFLLAEELLATARVDAEDWYGGEEGEPGIRDLVTVYGDGRIDVNGAPLEVLEAIPGMHRSIAEDIVAFRSGPDGKQGTEDDRKLKSVRQLKEGLNLISSQLEPLREYCKFGSDYHRITVTARRKSSRAVARISAVVRIQESQFEIVSWRED